MQKQPMPKLCDLQVRVNGDQTFILKEKIVLKYCGRLKKIINQQKGRSQIKKLVIEINDFPGGPDGFEMISRFCYSNGKFPITVSNLPLLHCCAIYLGMTEQVCSSNLLQQTETFLEGIYCWKWNDLLVSLGGCELIYSYADSYGLLERLICALLAKMAQNSDKNNLITTFSSSSSSSPETNSYERSSSSTKTTPEIIKSPLSRNAWWFEDLTSLPPEVIEKLLQSIGAYKADNNSLIFTRFLLHYLKTATQARGSNGRNISYAGIAETAAHGVILVGKKTFSCRGLFGVLRILSGFGLSRDCRIELEKLIGGMLDQATLDDLLVSGHDKGFHYDVNLVIRLIKVFVDVNGCEGVCLQKLKKVGRLIDKYLREISPDQNLNISKFLRAAESLPDSARDCFDGVYRAIDIYLQSHPTITFEETSRLCRCLNYNKLSFEACKELAKNPRIPPRIAMQALISQQAKIQNTNDFVIEGPGICLSSSQIILPNETDTDSFSVEKEDMRLSMQRMQCRVQQLEKLCKQMKVHMSRMVSHNFLVNPSGARTVPRFC